VRGKGGHQRVLPLSDETCFSMLRYLDGEPARHGPLIRSRVNPTRGISPEYVSDLVGETMRAAGVNETPHALRHTAATDMFPRRRPRARRATGAWSPGAVDHPAVPPVARR
jgi:site-specific recombinase XerD